MIELRPIRVVHGRNARSGFALVELLVVVGIGVLLAALLLIFRGDSRRNARLGQDLANLRYYGASTVAYAADNEDLMWGFSWQAGTTPGADPDLAFASSSLAAAAHQAVQILRDRTGRMDITPPSAWIAHISYSHLVLTDYNGAVLPDHAAVSTGDRNRTLWRDDPAGFDAGLYSPRPFGTAPALPQERRWPYSSSWQLGVAFFDRATTPSKRLKWGSSQGSFLLPSAADLGASPLSSVAFPSEKAMMFDEFQRHFGERQAFHAYSEARVPVLAVDGAVVVRTNGEGNIGWDPKSPNLLGESVDFYAFVKSLRPQEWWFPNPLNGDYIDENIIDRMMWTRGGIAGRDFDGPEIDTGQW